MDDRTGPLGLCVAVVIALFAILILSLVDFISVMNAKAPGPPPPAAATTATLLHSSSST